TSTSTILPTIWLIATTAGSTITCGPSSPPVSTTCAGTATKSSPPSYAPRASATNCLYGATAAITTGRGGGRWRGCICESALIASAQDRSHDPGIATSMNDGNHPKRLLVGGVNDEVITHKQKSQRSGREIRPGVTGLRKRDRRANCREDFF